MRVAFNLLHLASGSGGSATYARELLPALLAQRPDLRLSAFVSDAAPPDLVEQPWAQEVEWIALRVSRPGPVGMALRVGAGWGALPVLARRRRVDVIHGLANVAPLAAPGTAVVVTVLDLIWTRHPGVMSPRDRLAMQSMTSASARRADRVLAISQHVRDDVLQRYRLRPDHVDTVPLGFSLRTTEPPTETDVRARFDLPADRKVVLCVAQHREHKNLAALVRATPDDALLVLPGAHTAYSTRLAAQNVRLPGWVSERELEGLYAVADAFVLPSLEEGFGLPVLEAMGRGVPVACSNTASLPEVAGDAALQFDPHDGAALAAAVRMLVEDPGDLAERGRRQAARFPWSHTAELTLAAYERTLS